MKIKINGEEKIIEKGLNLLKLVQLELNSSEPKGVAAAVNLMVVPKQKWEDVIVNENDEIEIVQAVQGG
jgi:sulfur carrier protein